MKSWLIALCALTLLSVNADDSFFGNLNHDVVVDRFAKGGNILIQTIEFPKKDFFEVKINYKIKVKVLLFTKTVEGDEFIHMPNSYQTEQGFLDLERDGVHQDPRVHLVHQGRTNWGPYYDCHRVFIDPTEHNRWDGEFVYCPDIPKSGIGQMKLVIKDIPFLGKGTVVSRWNQR